MCVQLITFLSWYSICKACYCSVRPVAVEFQIHFMVLDYRHRQLIGNFLCTNCVVPSTSGNAPLVILLCLIYGICVLRYAVHRNDLELAPLFLLTDLKKPVCRSWALQKKVVFHCWAHGWKNESVFQLLLGVCSNRGSGILGDQYLALLSTVWAQILKRWTREVE